MWSEGLYYRSLVSEILGRTLNLVPRLVQLILNNYSTRTRPRVGCHICQQAQARLLFSLNYQLW